MSPRFEILPGLPGTGPMCENFSETGQGAHREGFVVRVFPEQQAPWVGNFQPGHSGVSGVFKHPNHLHLIVIANGLAYVVDPESKKALKLFGGGITEFLEIPGHSAFVAGDGIYLERLEASGVTWRTKRISWDGFRDVRISGDSVVGEAFSPIADKWTSFVVDLKTGSVQGGSYDGPPE